MAIPHYPAGVSPSWLPESPTSSSHGTEASYPIYRSNSINIPHSDPTDNGDDSPHTPPKSLLEDYLLNKRARIESHPDPTPNPKLKRAHVKPNSSYSLKQTIKQCKALSSQIFHYTAPSDQRPSENGPVKAFYAQARSQIHDFFSYLKTKMAPSPGDHAYYSQPFATKVSKLIHSVKYNPMPYYLYATDWDAHLGDFRPYFLTDPQGFRCDDLIQLNSTGSPFIRFSKIPLTLDHQTIKQIINGHIARSAKSWRLAYPEYISQLQMMQ
ncbi:hypothetical protein BJ085DRAFT_35365 [Dimargaris cristalligena]|uniref:Uncharacterized protein n=1 Tax=Dimargaris cristalligena TaxID=215637 RepID=A0A4V1J417_9FUNG|nr:hypothetical protein BJ085DRAFT_35365 [Dimargaris cristalligena]|eukprot:RKP33999.1 hypothetical protein BJ085DRAFT_35365 [Dimargaris cristalligena]